jgi:hypothetical protein
MGAFVLNSARDIHGSEYAHAPLIANDMPPFGTKRDFCQGAFQVLDSGG